jgi:hypothetical protein
VNPLLTITLATMLLSPAIAMAQTDTVTTEPDGTINTYNSNGALITQDSEDDQEEDQAVSEGLKADTPYTDPDAVNDPNDAPPSDFVAPNNAPASDSSLDSLSTPSDLSAPSDSSSDNGQ